MSKNDLDPDDPIVRTAVMGKVVEDFLTSEVGRLIAQYAQDQVDISTDEIKVVSPLRLFKVSRLQLRIELWEGLMRRLADVITDGLNATKILEGDE
jgi:hypothetical protein